jgi:hypothetical protein
LRWYGATPPGVASRAARWHEAGHLLRRQAEQPGGVAPAHAQVLRQLADGLADGALFSGDRGRPALACLSHRAEQGREVGDDYVQDDRLQGGADGLGDEVSGQPLPFVQRAALAVEVEARDIDGPPSADLVQHHSIAASHELRLLSAARAM